MSSVQTGFVLQHSGQGAQEEAISRGAAVAAAQETTIAKKARENLRIMVDSRSNEAEAPSNQNLPKRKIPRIADHESCGRRARDA